jgi:hypothetical protein
VAGGQIARMSADAFTVPTGGCTGLGYSYTTRAAATVVNDILAPLLMQGDLFAISAHHAVRAQHRLPRHRRRHFGGRHGALGPEGPPAGCAARVSLRPEPAGGYGSGGFTSYSDHQTIEQFSSWIDDFGSESGSRSHARRFRRAWGER